MASYSDDAIIRVRDLTVKLNENLILDHLDLDVRRGEILGFVGASGAGKSVLTRTIIGLLPKLAGNIEVFGVDMGKASEDQRRAVERRWGVLFQHGALFSSLSVRQNIQFPVREFMNVSERLLDEIAIAKLAMVGLKPEVADRFPSELSGGMIKRAALARALALDPLGDEVNAEAAEHVGQIRGVDVGGRAWIEQQRDTLARQQLPALMESLFGQFRCRAGSPDHRVHSRNLRKHARAIGLIGLAGVGNGVFNHRHRWSLLLLSASA